MSTELLEHFGNIEVKNWDLYHHNIGLKPTARYKTGFIIRTAHNTFEMYDSTGKKVSTMVTGLGKNTLQGIVPIPGKGMVVIALSDTSGVWEFNMFDGKTGDKVYSFSESSYDNGSIRGMSFDVLENGDLFILNRGSRILRIFATDGTLKESVNFSNEITNSGGLHNVSVNSKLRVVAIYNDTVSGKVTKIYNITEVSLKVPRITISGTGRYVKGFTQKGNIVEALTSDAQLIRIYQLDYGANVSLGYSQTSIFKSGWRYEYLRSIKDKVLFTRSYQSTWELAILNESDGVVAFSNLPLILNIFDVDDKYIYAADTTSYKVYKRDDLTLLLTIPTTYEGKTAKSNKGNYENFGKYW